MLKIEVRPFGGNFFIALFPFLWIKLPLCIAIRRTQMNDNREDEMILKMIAASAVGLCMTSGVAMAQVWQGQEFITAVTPGCAGHFDVGNFVTIVYRPILNSGDPPEQLSFVTDRSALAITSTGGSGTLRGSNPYNGFGIGRSANPFTYKGTANLNISPGNVTAGTFAITVKGKVSNFFDISGGCDVTIEGVLSPQL